MLGAFIYIKVCEDVCTKTCLGEHTLYCSPDKFCGFLLENLLGSAETLATRITGIANVNTVSHLLSLEDHLLCVYYDDVVTTVYVRSEAGLCLATEDKSNAGSETTKSETCRVNDNPILVYSRLVQRYCFVALCVHCLDL